MSTKARTTRIVAGLCLAAASLLVAGYALAQPPVTVKEGRFQTANEKGAMKAFRMKAGYKGDAQAKELAKKLFAKGRASQAISFKADKANNLIHVGGADPSAHFRINKSTGDFSFNKGLKDYFGGQETASLPDKNKAVEMAKKHLRELGLMPEKENEVVVRHVGGMKMIDRQEDGSVKEFDKLVTVHFGRKIDGVDVGGPGSKMIVSLGANGELVAVHRRWIEVREEEKKSADFKGKAEVHASVKARLAREGAMAKRIEATAPDFGYYDDGQGNIEPGYFFAADLVYDSAEVNAGKGHVDKYFGVVPALKGPKADFEQQQKARSKPNKGRKPDQDAPAKDDD